MTLPGGDDDFRHPFEREANMNDWETFIDRHRGCHLEQLIDFLRIPSVSSLPIHAPDVAGAAEWLASRLKAAGMEAVAVMQTGGHPVVYAEWCHLAGRPTVMIYGHFDVQPVDPVFLWTHPPFDPLVKDERVYARGASDDKGNLLAAIIGAEAILKTEGVLPVNLKFFFEGQEEIGSPQLPGFVDANRDLLRCDLVVSADGGQWQEDQPSLMTGLRGICSLQIDVCGASSDLHSGTYGGTIANPIHALARIVDSMHGAGGRVSVDGFYEAVRPLSEVERAKLREIPYDESAFMREIGVAALSGEAGFSTYERAWTRPTLEVNGMWGGFQEEGIKTVLPCRAHAKITCRLVPEQVPEEIVACVTRHVENHAPPGVTVHMRSLESRADPYLIPGDHPGNLAARKVLQAIYGKAPHHVRMGGTIPVCGIFLKYLKVYTVIFAFGLKDENIHAPDEFFRLPSFERAKRAYGLLLKTLGEAGV